MITNIELTDSGAAKFNRFFEDFAKPAVKMQAVMFELLDILQDLAGTGQSLVYELGRQYTVTGNPEILILEARDVLVTQEPDE